MLTDSVEIGGITWVYRPETNDLGIIEQCFTNNSCRLPEDLNGKTVLDIGAHIGAVSVLAATRGATVYAFEPGSENYQVLLANVFSNDLNIQPCHHGIGAPGVRKLYLDNYNTGQNSESIVYPEHDKDVFEYANFISLADMLAGKCDFLKLDCEGCEDRVLVEVLEGLYKRIQTMYREFHTSTQRYLIESLKKVYDVEFLGYGYLLNR